MLIVVDTNILINAIRSNNDHSKSIRLMDDIFRGVHQMCVSSAILKEYEEVMSRDQFQVDPKDVRLLMDWIRKNSYQIEPLPTRREQVEMKDEDDRPFYDVARCLNARLITRNYRHYPVDELVTLIDEMY